MIPGSLYQFHGQSFNQTNGIQSLMHTLAAQTNRNPKTRPHVIEFISLRNGAGSACPFVNRPNEVRSREIARSDGTPPLDPTIYPSVLLGNA